MILHVTFLFTYTSVVFRRLMQNIFIGYASLSFMWSVVEVNVSIICGCVPGLKPLVARIAPKLLNDTSNNDEYSRYAAEYGHNGGGASQLATTGNGNKSSSPGETVPESEVNMSTFLNSSGPQEDNDTATYNTSDSNHSMTFFDFVNVKKPTSMLKLSNRESIAPLALSTILFFLWGFAYGLLNILNSQFQRIIKADNWQSLGLHAAYFGGYSIGPCLGWFILRKWGFKGSFIVGLCLHACGSLIFWPSALLTSFVAFTFSHLIVGVGLAVLETAANPFIALCGPQEDSEIRLNISQGVQAIGGVVSPLLAKKVLFKHVRSVSMLVNVQWTYLAIALFDVLLAVAFYYLRVPEASDEDLDELANHRKEDNGAELLGVPVMWVTLGLGVGSLFLYVGAQEVLSTSFVSFVQASGVRCASHQPKKKKKKKKKKKRFGASYYSLTYIK